MISSTLQLMARSLPKNMIFVNGKSTVPSCLAFTNARDIHITSNATKEFRVGTQKVRAIVKGKLESVEGEHSVALGSSRESLFPDASTSSKLFNNVPYDQLHIMNVKSTPNNTIMSLTDATGLLQTLHSAGAEGFKNTKKGTNIAAQQTAFTFATRVISLGITTVRLRMQGIGPGRMGVIKGLELSGLNVVSITDDTRVSWNPPRPRKQRRI